MKIITKSEKETQEAGEKLVQKLAPGSVVAMYGDLGAGKTAAISKTPSSCGAVKTN